MISFESYQSPFSWRYGSPEMRKIWGEENKRLIWRKLWVAMAEAQTGWGLVTREQVQDLKEHMSEVDVARAFEIEKNSHHDLMAEIKVFAGQCPKGGGILHLGATSMDIKDNAEVLQIAQSLDILSLKLGSLLKTLAGKVEAYAGVPVMAFTHLQPAEPTTLGYRLAGYAQDLLEDYEALLKVRSELKGKGFKGAVGNAASYVMLFGLEGQRRFETLLSQAFGLPFFEVTTQTYPRKQDYAVLSTLAGLAATAYKIAFDLRLLQSEVIGELAEPFGEEQVGSSAMPFKRNPIEAEKINSLARAVSVAPLTAWNNYANSLLERTLDDSANRRTLFPETFLSVDEIVMTLAKIMDGLKVNPVKMQHNLDKFGPFAAVERVIIAAVKNGADRQEMHEVLRQLSMTAWQAIEKGQANPLAGLVLQDERVTCWVAPSDLSQLFAVEGYTGIAEPRAREMAQQIRTRIP
ncbi:MAG: adenylosuccinate lyase [Pelolinea sp.]|nr:adenylosuccinate lyase [Pelolinea sp.]